MPTPTDELFRALADPTRRGIFEHLCTEGGATVGALTARAGVSQPVVSKHLRTLREAGLVVGTTEGRQTRYAAQAAGLDPMAEWTARMAAFWNDRIDRLDDVLTRMDQ